MKSMKVAACVIFFWLSPPAISGDAEWVFRNVEIIGVDYGRFPGPEILVRYTLDLSSVDMSGMDPRVAACQPTANAWVVGRDESSTGRFLSDLKAVGIAANAQGKKVDILVNLDFCDTDSDHALFDPVTGAPLTYGGHGLELRAVRILND